ncbi:hypothetical protein Areg01_76540 [Actinoplanes regularis]|nr:hypothetical protein Areg01_76540 [Actinoplanes regularis]
MAYPNRSTRRGAAGLIHLLIVWATASTAEADRLGVYPWTAGRLVSGSCCTATINPAATADRHHIGHPTTNPPSSPPPAAATAIPAAVTIVRARTGWTASRSAGICHQCRSRVPARYRW